MMTSVLLFRRLRLMLFAMALLTTQGITLLHELEHGLAGEAEACSICLHASHDGNALPAAIIKPALPRYRAFHIPVSQPITPYLLPRLPAARAPPAVFSV